MKNLYFEHTFLSQTGMPHTLLLEKYGTFHNQCKMRSDWSFRTQIEAKASQKIFWCTLTYDNEHLQTSYKDCKNNNVGNIRKYLPPVYKKEYDKYMNLSEIDRQKYETEFSFNGKNCQERFKYFCAARGWLPQLDTDCTNDYNSLLPLYHLDKYYYYSKSDFDLMLSTCYTTRTGKILRGFNQFSDGFLYTKLQFEELKSKSLKKYCEVYNNYKFNPSDNGLLCKEHISKHIQKFQKIFKKYTGCTFRFMYNGEYGSAHHRPHYHVLVFIPSYVDLSYLPENFINDFINEWNYGQVKEIKEINKINNFNISRVVDYVGKHYCKWDSGNYWQQKMSPIFKVTSCYDGGIGYQLLDEFSPAYDHKIKSELLQLAGLRSPLVTINGYTHTLARFYRRALFPDYKYSDECLQDFTNRLLCTHYQPVLNKIQYNPTELLKDFLHLFKICCIFEQNKNSENPNDLNYLFENYDLQLVEEDKQKRNKALQNYVNYKNKWRRSVDRLEISCLID